MNAAREGFLIQGVPRTQFIAPWNRAVFSARDDLANHRPLNCDYCPTFVYGKSCDINKAEGRWPSTQTKQVRANWPQEFLYVFQSPSMALAISLAAERNQFDFLRRRSLKMLATWRLLPK